VTNNFSEAGSTIAAIVRHALDTSADQVEVTAEAEAEWVQLLEGSQRAFMGSQECTPGYYNNEGHAIGRKERLNGSGFPEGPGAYFRYIAEWRANGRFEGLEFRSR
jgi:hypothetical protein